MLSSFLKKLLFVRKFFIIDGKIELLDEKQVMLPISILDQLKGKHVFEVASRGMKKTIISYDKKIGTTSSGKIKLVQDVYEVMGLGKLQIINLDNKKKGADLRIEKTKAENLDLLQGIIGGLFSFIFSKDFKQENITITKKTDHFEIKIK
ncbi:MAG: hypothetical protein ABIA37_02680 [Candidatus Woesearchaeota archaeon]